MLGSTCPPHLPVTHPPRLSISWWTAARCQKNTCLGPHCKVPQTRWKARSVLSWYPWKRKRFMFKATLTDLCCACVTDWSFWAVWNIELLMKYSYRMEWAGDKQGVHEEPWLCTPSLLDLLQGALQPAAALHSIAWYSPQSCSNPFRVSPPS